MSNSIWHKSGLEVPATDNKARISRGGDIIYWTPYGWSHPKSYNHHRIGCEWAYLEDIIAQADKAERLQKAVDKAIWILEESKKVQRPDFKLGFTYCLFPQPHLDIILDEIKQLIKE